MLILSARKSSTKKLGKLFVSKFFFTFSEFLILKADVVKRLNDFEDSVMASISMELSDHHEFQVFQGEVALLAKNQLFNKYLLNISSLPLLKE